MKELIKMKSCRWVPVGREQIDDLAFESLLLLWLDTGALDLLHDVVVVQARDLGKRTRKGKNQPIPGQVRFTGGKERTWPAAASRLQFQLDMYTSWKSIFSRSTVGINCERNCVASRVSDRSQREPKPRWVVRVRTWAAMWKPEPVV